MRYRTSLLIAAALLAGSPLHAQGYREWVDFCSIGGPSLCAQVELFSLHDGSARLKVWNKSGLYGSNPNIIFTHIGFTNLPDVRFLVHGSPSEYEGAYVLFPSSVRGPATTASEWEFGRTWQRWGGYLNSFSFANTAFDAGYGPSGSLSAGIASSCGNVPIPTYTNELRGVSLTGGFYITPTCGATGLSDPVGDGSFELIAPNTAPITNWSPAGADLWISGYHLDPISGVATQVRCQTGVGGNCSMVTPEPVSMVLLGSGLAGIAAVRRRRRREEEEG